MHHLRKTGSLSTILTILLLILVALPQIGCSRGSEAAERDGESSSDQARKDQDGEDGDEKDKEKELVPVEVAALERGAIEAVLRFSTNLEAERDVQVFSEAARRVIELRVEEGDLVRKGQVLLRLQNEEQKSALARTESQLEKANREYERQKRLFERELISEQTFNDATYEVDQQRLALEDAKRELSYTDVRAPISGTITSRQVNLGDHITVNQHLFDIVDFDSIVARVFVPEKEVERLAVGHEARLFADARTDEARRGRVLRIAPVVDPRSGTIKTTVAIPRHQGLLPGQYVEVELITEVNEQALLVPKRAVVYDNDQAFVFRLKEAEGDAAPTVERLVVAPLLEDRSFIEPAGDVLQDGDRLVIAGQAGLKDGAAVRLLDPTAAEGPGAADDTEADDTADTGETAEAS